jgi:subtilase family serine protease
MSFDADPASGAWVMYAGSWYVVGGTSLSAPALAGIVNNSGNRLGVAPSPGGYYSNMEDNLLYAELFTYKEYHTNFYDVTTGSNGASAGPGWDYCTGVGSPRGRLGK